MNQSATTNNHCSSLHQHLTEHRKLAELNESLRRKLNPVRFPKMGLKMAALVGYVLGQKFTQPQIAELFVTSDSYVLARHSDELGFNSFIGSYSDFRDNWVRLLSAAS
jgi:hypothetical protein